MDWSDYDIVDLKSFNHEGQPMETPPDFIKIYNQIQRRALIEKFGPTPPDHEEVEAFIRIWDNDWFNETIEFYKAVEAEVVRRRKERAH